MKSEVGYRKCLWCAVILLSTSIFLLEPTAHAAAIVGHIGTPAGVPVQAVTVTATRTSPLQTLTDTTDAAGNYTLRAGFTGLSATYNVVPTKSGYTFNPASSNVTVTAAGPDETADFTTPASVPSATTQPPQSVSATSATLRGSVNPDGAATTAWFEYGLTTSYGGASPSTNAGNGGSAVAVNIGVSGLLNGTNYHCRAVASNSFGVTVGNDLTFATFSGIPSVTTLVPTDGGATTMKLSGSVNPNHANATAWFEWGTTSGYGNTTAMQSVGGGGISTNFSQVLNGLTAGATYHYRAVGSTTFGTSFGADVLFTPVFNDISAGLPGVQGSSVAWGDYDFDGRLDILLTGSTSGAASGAITQVWRNTGSGFVNIDAGLPGVYLSSVAWGDFNNDGWPDILLTGTTNGFKSGAIGQVWRNTGSGFVNIDVGLPGVYDSSVAWGDFDNDGRLDILLTGLTLDDALVSQVWRNTGSGFVNVNAGLPGVAFSSVAWGDYDNDGRLDILLTGYSGNGLIAQVWRNTGNGFSNLNAGLPGVYHSSVAWGDFDNDGRLDILLTGNAPGTLVSQVWRNTGSGFVNVNAGLPGVASSSVAWGDFDNDGRLDILLTGNANGTLVSQVWRNTGTGFSNINAGLPGSSPVAWGDYDNDGRLDILLTGLNANGTFAQVWRNNFPVANDSPAAPTGFSASASGTTITLSWNPASDSQTPAAGLTYNLRVGTTPGGQDIVAPMAVASGFRLVPQMGNAQHRLSSTIPSIQLGRTYYWSVQAIDTAFAGSPFAPKQSFTINTVVTPPNGIPVLGDRNGDGVVDQGELDAVLSNYWPYSPWLYMTNVAGLDGTNVTFALTNSTAGAYSVEYSTNLMDWLFLGPATPRYEFTDTNAPAVPQRYYRLRWP